MVIKLDDGKIFTGSIIPTPAIIFVKQMLTRDLIAVANLLLLSFSTVIFCYNNEIKIIYL